MKNKETLNNINCELDKIKQDNSDMEALKIYTKILEEIDGFKFKVVDSSKLCDMIYEYIMETEANS